MANYYPQRSRTGIEGFPREPARTVGGRLFDERGRPVTTIDKYGRDTVEREQLKRMFRQAESFMPTPRELVTMSRSPLGGASQYAMRQIAGRVFPWLADQGQEWLENTYRDMASALSYTPAIPPVAGEPGLGFIMPPGWQQDLDCLYPNVLIRNYSFTNQCTTYFGEPPTDTTWEAADLAGRVTWTSERRVSTVGVPFTFTASSWHRTGDYPSQAPEPAPGEDSLPAQGPSFGPQTDDELLGNPGVSPRQMASASPMFRTFDYTLPLPINRLGEFNRWAQSGTSPYILRQVGPSAAEDAASKQSIAELASASALTRPLLESEVAPGPWQDNLSQIRDATGEAVEVVADPAGGVSLRPPTHRYSPVAGRPRTKERKMSATPHWFVIMMAVATYSGATVRNLHRALPRECKSRMRKHPRAGETNRTHNKRRFDSMMKDIYKCWDKVDLDRFLIYETESFVTIKAAGWAQSKLDPHFHGLGFGGGTQFWHAQPPSLEHQFGDTPYGGPFSNRQDPLGGLSELKNWVNRLGGI